MRLPKFLRRLRARLGGYFWLPCPLCGEMFGGFEIPPPTAYHWVYLMGEGTMLVCRECERSRRGEIQKNHVEWERAFYNRKLWAVK